MTQAFKRIEAHLVEYRCEDCGRGVFRTTGAVTHTKINQWEHRCTHCDRQTWFTVCYPMIRYKDRNFGLADQLRHVPPT